MLNYNLHVFPKFGEYGWVISFYDPSPTTENVYGGIGHRIELDIWMTWTEAKSFVVNENREPFWMTLEEFKLQHPEMINKRIKKHITSITS